VSGGGALGAPMLGLWGGRSSRHRWAFPLSDPLQGPAGLGVSGGPTLDMIPRSPSGVLQAGPRPAPAPSPETPPADVQVLRPYGVGIDTHSRFIQVCVMYQFTPRDGPVVVRKQEAQFKTHWQKLVDAKRWVLEILGSPPDPGACATASNPQEPTTCPAAPTRSGASTGGAERGSQPVG
jgi:hypothetical protein